MNYDAIIVGAGHHGLVTALYLARAGWSVLVLEGNSVPGGAVRSAEVSRPGFISDLYATNLGGFLGGPVWRDFGPELERAGLRFAHSDAPFANAFPDGGSLRVYQDAERTIDGLARHHPDDARGWQELGELFARFAPVIFAVYGSAMPSAATYRAVVDASNSIGRDGLAQLSRLVLCSTRELGQGYFATREAQALIASWGLHVDHGPDVSGGALFPFIEAFAEQQSGMVIAEGGAGRLIDALLSLATAAGVTVEVGTPVVRIEVEKGRAVGVSTSDGVTYGARRAVIASVTPTALYDRLLDPAIVPSAVRREARRYSYGPGTMVLHLALDRRLPWRDPELERFAYVHIAPYTEDLAETYVDAMNGTLPASPLLVVGQSSQVDPTRAPDGQHVAWVLVRCVPSTILRDRAGVITGRTWSEVAEPYAERVLDKLEQYAPGARAAVLDRAVISPADLEASNPNLVGGDNGAGSHHLHQSFLLRPLPGHARHATVVPRLWMTGQATWPGGGVNGIAGYLTAHEVLNAERPWPGRLAQSARDLTSGAIPTVRALRGRRHAESLGEQ